MSKHSTHLPAKVLVWLSLGWIEVRLLGLACEEAPVNKASVQAMKSNKRKHFFEMLKGNMTFQAAQQYTAREYTERYLYTKRHRLKAKFDLIGYNIKVELSEPLWLSF